MTIEEQLKAAQAQAAKLREVLRKAKASAKRAKADAPQFPGSHRGY